MNKSPSDYDIGYGKPPDSGKFGHRPQPQHRRSKKSSIPDVLSLLDKPAAATRDGKPIKIHPHEAMILSLFKLAMKRKVRAMKALFIECEKAGLLEPPAHARSSGVLVCPKWMPMGMMSQLIKICGAPPWPAKIYNAVAAEFADSLALFAEWYPGAREAQEDDFKR